MTVGSFAKYMYPHLWAFDRKVGCNDFFFKGGPSCEAADVPSGEGSSPNVVQMLTSFERLKLNMYPQALAVG